MTVFIKKKLQEKLISKMYVNILLINWATENEDPLLLSIVEYKILNLYADHN